MGSHGEREKRQTPTIGTLWKDGYDGGTARADKSVMNVMLYREPVERYAGCDGGSRGVNLLVAHVH